jgi:hypothetical protein
LDYEVLARRDRLLDKTSHFELAGAVFGVIEGSGGAGKCHDSLSGFGRGSIEG